MLRFFQAEDGIRGIGVTGVQTCALPICSPGRPLAGGAWRTGRGLPGELYRRAHALSDRSEERRVGKEGRWRRPAQHVKKEVNQRDAVVEATADKWWVGRAVLVAVLPGQS